MAVLISICAGVALADSEPAVPYTLQVASFPKAELADRFIAKLVRAGEHPLWATVELEGRGLWTRVFVGIFSTGDAAHRYGEDLVARGVVDEFLVRRADLNQAFTRPKRVERSYSNALGSAKGVASYVAEKKTATGHDGTFVWSATPNKSTSGLKSPGNTTVKVQPVAAPLEMYESAVTPLPYFRAAALGLVPCIDTGSIPRPEPVTLALRLIVGGEQSYPLVSRNRGGLWITGDTAEGLARLRWIVGEENAELIKLDDDGRVQLDRGLLAKAAGLVSPRVEDPLQIANYISSNEGLLLLVQLAEGRYRYRLHAGQQAPTHGKTVDIGGSINLDKNFDSRINPYRKDGKKLETERPPEGFDSLVAVNPIARWYNMRTNYWVQVGEITFHELAEAYAKLELGLDYLERGSQPGAHAVALERELRLKSQRPAADIVLTAGSNRLLRTEQEIRLFYEAGPAGVSHR